MGLDMYLVKKMYVGNKEREKLKISGISGINPAKVNEITEEGMYWRKANAIHKWFVDNVQDGKDDCKEYYVDEEQLKKLSALVDKVLADHSLAKELLPAQEGYFFGGTEYDEYYFKDLEDTKKGLEEILSDNNKGNFEYYYHSSW